MTQRDPWYVDAFRGEYLTVYPHRDLVTARVEARWLMERGVGGRLLDMACGYGRHVLAFREQGVDAYGMDLSMDLLRRARELPTPEMIDTRLVRGDVRCVPFQRNTFDAVVVLFSSFGYFGEDGDRAMLGEIARVLKLNGVVVLDLMNPERVRASLVPHSRSERDGLLIDEKRIVRDDGKIVEKSVRITEKNGMVRSWRESVRMYDVEEMRMLLAGRGLWLEAVDGGFKDEPLGPDAPRQILRARRSPAPV
jgi:ubiquinone/menaquinone biosynthesis C-methylase UbiE